MFIDFNLDNIKDEFDQKFQNYDVNKAEFFGKYGREHYRLLAYLSTLFEGKEIFDIGTHLGSSSLALSFNEKNIIQTFDIMEKIKPDIKNRDNICFNLEDLFCDETLEKWKSRLLESPLILIDIDPHEGTRELKLYNFLKDNNYRGIIILDDIWYFKEMRDNLWYHIDTEYKYDITQFGHWSGTGLVTFNKDITLNITKSDHANWTLVTAYFNLTKCYDASEGIKKRDQNHYIINSKFTLSLDKNLVIYCDHDSYELIKNIRPKKYAHKTIYHIMEFDKIPVVKTREKIKENRIQKPYYFDDRNTPSYYTFCMTRYWMLMRTIEDNPFDSTHFCWINFCMERMGFNNLLRLDECLDQNRDKFSTCYIDFIPESLIQNTHEYFRYGRCSMCSGFFTGNKEYMYKVCDLITKKFYQYLEMGYGHADEQLYSPVYFENPDLFEFYWGDYQQMITNYHHVYDEPENVVRNFITNSYNNGRYDLCLKGCEFLQKSIELQKCEIRDGWYAEQFRRIYNDCKNKQV